MVEDQEQQRDRGMSHDIYTRCCMPAAESFRTSTRNTRSSMGTPQVKASTDSRSTLAKKRKRGSRADEAEEEINATEGEADEERPDDSTTAGSPARTTGGATSKPGRGTAKQKAVPASSELRRSNRRR